MQDRNNGLARTEPNENIMTDTWAYITRKTVNRHANSHIESCGARTNKGVTDLNIELDRQKLDQTDVRERLKDVQLPCNATEVSDVACEH